MCPTRETRLVGLARGDNACGDCVRSRLGAMVARSLSVKMVRLIALASRGDGVLLTAA
jgi:hypothetical protein